MDLYEVKDTETTVQDDAELEALTARILPLPRGILPSTIFMKQTRELLLSLNDQSAFRAA